LFWPGSRVSAVSWDRRAHDKAAPQAQSRDSLFARGMVIRAIVTILFETGSIHD
jgi:hypothetical protein